MSDSKEIMLLLFSSALESAFRGYPATAGAQTIVTPPATVPGFKYQASSAPVVQTVMHHRGKTWKSVP